MLCIFALFWNFLISKSHGEFTESLHISIPSQGVIATHFTFQQSLPFVSPLNLQFFNFKSFPRTIVEIVKEYEVRSLRVGFSRGRWQYEQWGIPLIQPTSTGIELKAQFSTLSLDNSKKNWKRLTSTLSGMFCASINLINDHSTQIPQIPNSENDKFTTFFGQLPGEAVCTENLTPWTKLLPCTTTAGLGLLLNPSKIFDSSFHQFDVSLESSCDGNNCQIKLRQDLVVIFDFSGKLNLLGAMKIKDLFGREIKIYCAASDGINVQLPDGTKEILKNDKGDLIIPYNHSQRLSSRQSEILVDRELTGVGQERGGITIRWINRSTDRDIQIHHLETFPHYIQIFLSQSTMTIGDGQELPFGPGLFDKIVFSPGINRARPFHLEFLLTIPASTEMTLKVPFEKMFLRFTDFSFDPNRGFDLASSFCSYLDYKGHLQEIRTRKLLITIPTPDFTMPFNVITLTSTLVVLFYGTFFNLTYRRFYKGRNKRTIFKKWLYEILSRGKK